MIYLLLAKRAEVFSLRMIFGYIALFLVCYLRNFADTVPNPKFNLVF